MAREMELVGVRVQMPTNAPILLLREVDGEKRTLPIYIGGPEAHAIDLALSETKTARPMTHDLVVNLLEALNASIEQIVITELRQGTFYADLYLRDAADDVSTLSVRPSDAIAIAVRLGTPIFADEDLVDEAGVETEEDDEGDEEEMVEELRKFLDQVNPEDFKS